MAATAVQRTLVQSLGQLLEQDVLMRGWVYRLRVLAKTTFLILRDCSGEVQCVATSDGAIASSSAGWHGRYQPLPRNFPVRAGFREEGEGHVGRGGHRWRAQSKGGSGCRGVLSADVPLCPCDR